MSTIPDYYDEERMEKHATRILETLIEEIGKMVEEGGEDTRKRLQRIWKVLRFSRNFIYCPYN